MKNKLGYYHLIAQSYRLIAQTIILLTMVFVPLIVLLALNTLFPVLDIQYNVWTWAASLFLLLIFNVVKLGSTPLIKITTTK
jgi:hypothetical protein